MTDSLTLAGALAQAVTHHQAGRLPEAEALYRLVLKASPDCAEAHSNLGVALYDGGRLEEAAASYRRALEIKPDFVEAHNNLGNVLRDLGRLTEAEESCRTVLALQPNLAEAHNNLGNALRDLQRLEEAETCFLRAVAIKPDFVEAHSNLGGILRDLGRLDEAEARYRRALAIKPDSALAHSNLLITLALMPRYEGAAILAQAKCFGEVCEAPFRDRLKRRHRNTPDPERPLRVGFLSPSLTGHVLANDLEPVFRAHRREQVSVHVYAHVPRPDATTWRLKDLSDTWTFVHGLSDDQVAARIEQDGIDILVDPMGHWAGNRLMVFARKPAPIQVSYLCQGLTSGLAAMDYAIGDRWLNADGAMQAFAREKVIELANGFEVTHVRHTTAIGPPPAAAAGFITFGSFNNPSKISDPTLTLWGEVLRRQPTARLLLKGKSMDRPENRASLLRRLEAHGIAAERTDLLGFIVATDHMEAYNRVDIILDTLPFCGGRTTVEALWMGVPVLTRIGSTVVGRYGFSHVNRIGVPELAAVSDAAYVDSAVALANDLPRLHHYRHTLRDAMRASSLLNAEGHVAELEQAYRTLWHRWCAGEVTQTAERGESAG